MILAQDGYGPSDKVEVGIDVGHLDGVILSTKTRRPETLPQLVSTLRSRDTLPQIFLDTHFYASDMNMTSPGNLKDFNLFNFGLTKKEYTIKNVQNYSRRIIDYQRGLGLSNIIVPSLMISNFDDFASLLSLQFYETSLEYISDIGESSARKVYLTLALRESCLRDREQLSKFLDDITVYDNIAGFYIVVERESGAYPQWQSSETLAKLMYIVQTLSASYEVICGFTDFSGLPMLASGASYVASGWSQTLRQYTPSYFMKSGGGSNKGKFRYASKELLTQLLSIPDLQGIIKKGLSQKYIDQDYLEGLEDPDNMSPSPLSRVLHQWSAFRELGKRIVDAPSRLDELEIILGEARANFKELRDAKVVIDSASLAHYDVWQKAINDIRAGVL